MSNYEISYYLYIAIVVNLLIKVAIFIGEMDSMN